MNKSKDLKTKYDWPIVKQEFFESDYQEVKAFFKSKFGRFDGNMSLRSRGWPGEKKQWRVEQVQLALQNLQSDRVEGIKKTLDQLVGIGQEEVKRMIKTGRVNVKSWARIWEVFRTEGGLPKAINSNINENTNIDLATARQSLLDKVNSKK